MDYSGVKLVEKINVGSGCVIEDGAIVGYIPVRDIADYTLTIGNEARVRAGTIIYGGTRIGFRLETGHGVVIREQNRIGDNFCIWNNSTIDYGCFIGNNVKVHCNCYIAQYTIIEDGVFIAPGVVFANDLHPLCCGCMKGPTIKRGARIGVGAVILPGVIIGERSLIGAGAVVTQDVFPESVVVGNPGRVIKSIYDLKCRTGFRKKPYSQG